MNNKYELYEDNDERDFILVSGKIYLKVKNYFFVYDLKKQKLMYSDLKNLLNEIFYESYQIIDYNIFSPILSERTKTIWLENFGTIKYIYPVKYVNRNLTKIFNRIFDCNYNLKKIF